MRIIAGKWRSRRLEMPSATTTRPLPDRVKESLFNMLGHHFDTPGMLPPIVVADVFAGSGSFGLESLSRGACECHFFENNKDVLPILRRNIENLTESKDYRIFTGDAWRMATQESHKQPYDLILLDPPYREALDASADGPVIRFLSHLKPADNGTLVVLHHPGTVTFAVAPGSWSIADTRRIGTNGLTFFSQ